MEECYNRKNLDSADSFFASDFVSYGRGTDIESFKQNLAMFHETFPDLHVIVDDVITAGSQVVLRVTSRGTHRGVFTGIAPTDKHAVWTGIDIFRIAQGKIVELWVAVDTLGLLQQLGAEVK